MINKQDIENIAAAFIPEYRDFVTGSFPSTIAHQFAKKHQFSDAQSEALSDGILLYLLTVHTLDDLVDYITSECELSEDEARTLSRAILLTLPPNFSDLQEMTQLSLQVDLAHNDEAAPANTESNKTIPTIRTMASDMSRAQATSTEVPTYSSTQEAILREGRTEAK